MLKHLPLIGLGAFALCAAALKPLPLPLDAVFCGQPVTEHGGDALVVPEPSTYVMILSGAGMLFLFGRFRRKR